MGYPDKIKQSAAQVLLANERVRVPHLPNNQFSNRTHSLPFQLRAERDTARRRVEAVGSHLNRSADVLDNCRRELDAFRRATFESFAAQHPPPPSYDAVTANAAASPPPPPPAISPAPSFPAPSGRPPSVVMMVDEPGTGSTPMNSPPPTPVVAWGDSTCLFLQ
jgi:hypothetical protein